MGEHEKNEKAEPGEVAVLPLPRGGRQLPEVGRGTGERLDHHGGELLPQDSLRLRAAGHDALIASVPVFNAVTILSVISGYDFYVIILREIVGWAVVFSAPVYLVALLKFRFARRLGNLHL